MGKKIRFVVTFKSKILTSLLQDAGFNFLIKSIILYII